VAKSITENILCPVETFLQRARARAREVGATFNEKDTTSGRFEVKGVVGEYRIDGQQITVTILSWKLLLWFMVKAVVTRELRELGKVA